MERNNRIGIRQAQLYIRSSIILVFITLPFPLLHDHSRLHSLSSTPFSPTFSQCLRQSLAYQHPCQRLTRNPCVPCSFPFLSLGTHFGRTPVY